jgi:hypothetical protein
MRHQLAQCVIELGAGRRVNPKWFGRNEATALNPLQITEPLKTQRQGEAPVELALLRLRRSVALPTNESDAIMFRAMASPSLRNH